MDAQELMDRLYMKNGPCCAGCDWWRYNNGILGDCTRHAPTLPGADRAASLGMNGFSCAIPSGHAVTKRDHHCGDFKDGFDWSTLGRDYLGRIGYYRRPTQKAPTD